MTCWVCDFIVLFQSLLLLAYMVRNGSERVVTSARDHMYDLKALEDYQFRDENGRDQGINGTVISITLDSSGIHDNIALVIIQYCTM